MKKFPLKNNKKTQLFDIQTQTNEKKNKVSYLQ